MPKDILYFASYWVGMGASKSLNKTFRMDWPHTLVFFPPLINNEGCWKRMRFLDSSRAECNADKHNKSITDQPAPGLKPPGQPSGHHTGKTKSGSHEHFGLLLPCRRQGVGWPKGQKAPHTKTLISPLELLNHGPWYLCPSLTTMPLFQIPP